MEELDNWLLIDFVNGGPNKPPSQLIVGDEANTKRFTYVIDENYDKLVNTLKSMWYWVHKTAYAEQGYLSISELKDYAQKFKECGVFLYD